MNVGKNQLEYEKDKFLGITALGVPMQFDTFEIAANFEEVEYILILKYKRGTVTAYGNPYITYQGYFYDKNKNLVRIRYNNFTIVDVTISDGTSSYYGSQIYVSIIDKNGKIEHLSDNRSSYIGNIFQQCKEDLIDANDWEDYHIKKEAKEEAERVLREKEIIEGEQESGEKRKQEVIRVSNLLEHINSLIIEIASNSSLNKNEVFELQNRLLIRDTEQF